MRDAFHQELDALTDRLLEMARLVSSAMAKATAALLDTDLRLAEAVISGDDEVDRLRAEVEGRAFALMATQQPVVIDLRMVIAALKMIGDLERMGDLAEHVAKITRMRYPNPVIPRELHATISQMDQIAERLIAKTATCIATRDLGLADELQADDEAMNRLRDRLFRVVLSEEWTHGIEPAIDVTLIGRYYERYADHAVRTAQDLIYLVTGDRCPSSTR